jgi:hypothetical protein
LARVCVDFLLAMAVLDVVAEAMAVRGVVEAGARSVALGQAHDPPVSLDRLFTLHVVVG